MNERELFERDFDREWGDISDRQFRDQCKQWAWWAWQARAALQSAPGQEPSLYTLHAQAVEQLNADARRTTPPTSATDNREVTLLRAVYEAARRFLRNNGVDRERASAAVDELDDAIERVKNFDGGYDEVDTVWDTRLPERDPNKPDAEQGLYRKYIVTRTDGSSAPGGKHEHCEYFVLDLDHDPHAIPALETYAESCKDEYPELAADLNERAWSLKNERCLGRIAHLR